MSSKLFYYSDNGQDQFCYLIFKTQYFTIIKKKVLRNKYDVVESCISNLVYLGSMYIMIQKDYGLILMILLYTPATKPGTIINKLSSSTSRIKTT